MVWELGCGGGRAEEGSEERVEGGIGGVGSARCEL